MRKRNVILALTILLAMFLIGCSDSTNSTPTIERVSIISPSETVYRGQAHQFRARVHGENNPRQGVLWSVLDGVEGTAIDSLGVLTVAANEYAPAITIIARSAVITRIYGQTTVRVAGSSVTEVSVYPSRVTSLVGQTVQFSATVEGEWHESMEPELGVRWSVSRNTVQTTSINEYGLLSIGASEISPSLLVTARSAFDNTVFGTATVSLGGPINVSTLAEWNLALHNIRTGGHNRLFTLNIVGEVRVPSPDSLFGGVTNLQVVIQGGGTLALARSSNGTLLDIWDDQIVIARNVTLQGGDWNTAGAVVRVGAGGTFEMNDGSTVRDNNSRGVLVDGGTLIMNGGTITRNTLPAGQPGAGVALFNHATFEMRGNSTISSNGTTALGSGGGVYVSRGSSFIMTNGTISGNTSHQGGGIYLDSTIREEAVSFTMNGGTIRDNVSNRDGGGVYSVGRYASVIMNAGTISDNRSGAFGGGLWVGAGDLVKLGGTISGNIATERGRAVYGGGRFPHVWRNANAGATDNTTGNFWLND
jgi:hypothetical protein